MTCPRALWLLPSNRLLTVRNCNRNCVRIVRRLASFITGRWKRKGYLHSTKKFSPLSEYVHIVCLDAPEPADYGGAIDRYYMIRSLAATGKKIILHYFDYRKGRHADSLKDTCTAIHSYTRKKVGHSMPLLTPHIVGSRINPLLIERLNKDDYPVILEGFHCAGILPFLQHPERAVIRVINNEAAYYEHLFK